MSLRKQIAEKREQATELARRARRVEADPPDAHECEVLSNKLSDEARAHEMHLKSNTTLAESLEKSLRYLEESRFGSRERAIVKTKLEEAVMWLERENGTKSGQDAHAP